MLKRLLIIGLVIVSLVACGNYTTSTSPSSYVTSGNIDEEISKCISDIYTDLKEVDIDGLVNSIDYSFVKSTVNDVKDFFSGHRESKTIVEKLISNIAYEIVDVTNEGDIYKVKIAYKCPSVKDMSIKLMPKVMLKYGKELISGNVNNDTIDSIIKMLEPDIDSKNFAIDEGVFEIHLKKIDGNYVITDFDKIVESLEAYVNLGGNYGK